MYLNEKDLKLLSHWLNQESDIAIIKSIGERQWKAFDEISIESAGRYCLYHKKAGPLPLLNKKNLGDDITVKDPFSGWTEIRSGADPTQPYFGPAKSAVYWLNIRISSNSIIEMSSFEWVGNHYSIIGEPAAKATKKWWNRLRRWVKKQSTHIPRTGDIDCPNKEIYAFDNAFNKISNGSPRALNP